MGICSSENEAPVNPNRVDASHFSMMKVVGQGGFGKVNAVNNRVTGALLAMKRMKKTKLIQKPIYVSTAWRERDVMSKVKSKFLVNLNCSFQDERYLYVIMPFMQGGDLRYYMNTKGRMEEDMARFYMAEILLGLEELHGLHIAYRDLKPDNVLLDDQGHVRISDFGLAVFLKKEDNYLTAGTAGTPGYQAPEVMERGSMYGISADVYSFGVMLFELLQNVRPYQVGDEANAVPPSQLIYDYEVSPAAKDLIERLLEREVSKRLGCGKDGLAAVKRHPFFNGIDWEKLAAHHPDIVPPFQPDITRANCSGDFELHEQFFGDEDKEEPLLTENQQKNFEGFEFNTEFTMPAEGLRKPLAQDS